MNRIPNYLSVAVCLAVILFSSWNLWISVPLGLFAGWLVAQAAWEYFPVKPAD